jgi:hypothetical protein
MRLRLLITLITVAVAAPRDIQANQASLSQLMAATVFVQVQGRGADGKPTQWSGTGSAKTETWRHQCLRMQDVCNRSGFCPMCDCAHCRQSPFRIVSETRGPVERVRFNST